MSCVAQVRWDGRGQLREVGQAAVGRRTFLPLPWFWDVSGPAARKVLRFSVCAVFQSGALAEKASGKGVTGTSEKKVKILEHQRNEVSWARCGAPRRTQELLA